jgi:hypothetical protein
MYETALIKNLLKICDVTWKDRLCGLVVRVLAANPEVQGSIPGATRFSK